MSMPARVRRDILISGATTPPAGAPPVISSISDDEKDVKRYLHKLAMNSGQRGSYINSAGGVWQSHKNLRYALAYQRLLRYALAYQRDFLDMHLHIKEIS
jgi:hypothetical protein